MGKGGENGEVGGIAPWLLGDRRPWVKLYGNRMVRWSCWPCVVATLLVGQSEPVKH